MHTGIHVERLAFVPSGVGSTTCARTYARK
jgi:hypothetical protein